MPDDWLTLTVADHRRARRRDDRRRRRSSAATCPALEPLAGFLAVAGNGGPFFGPTDYAIALAKEALGDLDAARAARGAGAASWPSEAGAVLWLPAHRGAAGPPRLS